MSDQLREAITKVAQLCVGQEDEAVDTVIDAARRWLAVEEAELTEVGIEIIEDNASALLNIKDGPEGMYGKDYTLFDREGLRRGLEKFLEFHARVSSEGETDDG